MLDKSALVTGGAGFIGSHIVDYLAERRWYVKVIDNFSGGRLENLKKHEQNPNVEVIMGDLKNYEDCVKAVQDVEVVFHFAANPEVRVSTTHPRTHFNENIVATFNLLEAIRHNNIKYLVFASSSSVYGEPKTIPVPEDAPLKPVSVYGASKLACEALIRSYSILYGIRSVVLRYANVIGPRLRHGVVYDFIRKLLENPTTLEILGDGTQIRSFVYVSDAVVATIKVLNNTNKYFEVFNIASEDWITIKQVADIVVETMELKNVNYVYRPVLHGVGWLGDVKKIALDIRKLRTLGFRPKYSSVKAVKLTVQALLAELRDTP